MVALSASGLVWERPAPTYGRQNPPLTVGVQTTASVVVS